MPAPPARLPVRPSRRARSHLVVIVCLFVPAAYLDLAARPDGDDVRRIGAIQKAGAATAQGTITAVSGLRQEGSVNKRMHYSGDVTVEVAGEEPGTVQRITAPDSQLGTARSAGAQVAVLYAPGSPGLGGFVDESGNVAVYADGHSDWRLVPTASGGGALVLPTFIVGLLLLVLVILEIRPRADVRVLRADAARGARLPAVRARVTGAVRAEYTTLGDTAGRTRTKTRRWLRVDCEDGAGLHLTSDDDEQGFASISADLAGRQGWLVGAERWRLIPGAQPVAFVSDDDEVLWAYADRQSFEDVLGATAVEVTAERRVRLLAPRTSAALTPARLPWLGLLALGWVLALPVLVTPSTWLLSWALCALSLGAVVVACVQLPKRLGRAADRMDGWEVMRSRDPALGP
ncbi:hypothetical protein AB0G20_21810 [Streptomyces sp. NPDC024017]|uniref:hypothetical protein n=1 Tax=Streptomyces sp. NPDC024017 TaxID=3154326 RepID=UPI0033D4144C